MNLKSITDRKSFIEYLKKYDKNYIKKYLILIDDLQKQCTHDLYFLSNYILSRMIDKDIKNKFNYFKNSLISNIKKLNQIQNDINVKTKNEVLPAWFEKEIEEKQASCEKYEEMERLLSGFK